MNVNIGPPYEAIMDRAIEEGYAGNRTEVIRQALMSYARSLEWEEENRLVAKKVDAEMKAALAGKAKTKSLGEIRKKYKM